MFSVVSRLQGALQRVPQRLQRILIAATIVYFGVFLWIYCEGYPQRLFNFFQWKFFFETRFINHNIGGRNYFYGDSVGALFSNWLVTLGVIAGAYIGYVWIAEKKKPAPPQNRP